MKGGKFQPLKATEVGGSDFMVATFGSVASGRLNEETAEHTLRGPQEDPGSQPACRALCVGKPP